MITEWESGIGLGVFKHHTFIALNWSSLSCLWIGAAGRILWWGIRGPILTYDLHFGYFMCEVIADHSTLECTQFVKRLLCKSSPTLPVN